ncbi:prokaryotic E2 ligase family D protein [Flavobacterium sp. NRK1]|uniref:prokaryotic E2 ligase family D protein n=1 Tax=Flavobacterium sp. NRK1 TaxID=2954929 RepID=UPI0020935AD4|nr:prokaryotic E2 ligase family D protein [Flavobacterium sp. NRK1]MCO6148918.1 prokaryotic E2 ligase family D protein [Flavobacterium sp. NRK1]
MTSNVQLYQPKAALVVFTASGFTAPYIEYYDMDETGSPVNPHPLTVREAQSLAKALDTREQAGKAFLRPEGILPTSVLHLDPSDNGSVIWYTKPQRQKLYFAESLGLENGRIALPALVWKATKKELQIFALKSKTKPKAETPLFHAPFFNLYQKGNVCMGTVNVAIKSAATLEEFITAWQGYFFGSYFSHHINEHNPVGVNLFNLYKELMADPEKPFPTDTLRTTPITLKNLL